MARFGRNLCFIPLIIVVRGRGERGEGRGERGEGRGERGEGEGEGEGEREGGQRGRERGRGRGERERERGRRIIPDDSDRCCSCWLDGASLERIEKRFEHTSSRLCYFLSKHSTVQMRRSPRYP